MTRDRRQTAIDVMAWTFGGLALIGLLAVMAHAAWERVLLP